MSSTAAVPAMGQATTPGRGRTTVAPRALDRMVSAVTADTFGVTAHAVHVELSDRDGLLALHVRTPIQVVSLKGVKQKPGLVEGSGGTLLQRASHAQQTIRERVTALTGAEIAHVSVELTGIEIQAERRVA
ncbi:hypothetical protein GCM10022288_24970 [Gryllotalpicola kribbensis]|uniref:Asp23/Gls24 family envelope stress response protein n=1 Tax=Gryllotalpicola kribbensis TaxID=993084 RepID=A0ABP8AX29_9MICO